MSRRKEAARLAHTPVAEHSKKLVLLAAWGAFWKALPSKERQAIVADPAFQAALNQRGRR